MADFEQIIRKHAGADGNVPATAIGELAKAIGVAVGNEFVDKVRYKAKLDEIETLKSEKQTAEDSATTAEKWKTKYEAEKAEHEKTKSNYAAKETAATNERLFRARLTEIGITGKRADQILKMTDLSAFEVENGAYKDAAAVDTHIRTEWSEFVPEKGKKGADVPNPPGNNGGKTDLGALSMEEYIAARKKK